MSNSFKPTANKCVNRLSYVRITPISANVEATEHKSMRAVPFVDAHSMEQMCLFRAKLSTANSSSMNNTTCKQQQQQANLSDPNQSRRDSIVSSHSKFSVHSALPSVPILNPIYFCISSPSRQFSAEFN